MRSCNKLPSEVRKRMHDKFECKLSLSNYIKEIDVLNKNGTPLESLRLEQQILYAKNSYTANSNAITNSSIHEKTLKHAPFKLVTETTKTNMKQQMEFSRRCGFETNFSISKF